MGAGGAPAGSTSGGGTSAGGTVGAGGTGGIASSGGSGGDVGSDPEAPDGYVKALVAVGYGGIRLVSVDSGLTWTRTASFAASGGDDLDLLRAVVYGKGTWVATGWKLLTSPDGRAWTDHGKVNEGGFIPCNIIEGLAYADGWFYAACPGDPTSVTYRSSDGLEWSEYGTIGETAGHLFLTRRGGVFAAYGDNGKSFFSDDGLSFTEDVGLGTATYCEDTWKSEAGCFDAAWFEGAYYRGSWPAQLLRSTDGTDWDVVFDDDEGNGLYRPRAMAAGYVSP